MGGAQSTRRHSIVSNTPVNAKQKLYANAAAAASNRKIRAINAPNINRYIKNVPVNRRQYIKNQAMKQFLMNRKKYFKVKNGVIQYENSFLDPARGYIRTIRRVPENNYQANIRRRAEKRALVEIINRIKRGPHKLLYSQ